MSLDDASGCGRILDLFVALPLGLILVWSLLWRSVQLRRAAHWRAIAEGKGGLRPGWSMIRGTVETDPPTEPAIVIDVEQRGSVYYTKSHLAKTSWKEIARRTIARPFAIVRDDGTRVRVEPDERVRLEDLFDAARRSGPDRRIRTATLSNGEIAYVLGRLEIGADGASPYREGPPHVMKTPARGHMTISTRPLDEKATQRASFHGGMAIWCVAITFIAYVASITMQWHRLRGEPGACAETVTVLAPFTAMGTLLLYPLFFFLGWSKKLSDLEYGDLEDARHYEGSAEKASGASSPSHGSSGGIKNSVS